MSRLAELAGVLPPGACDIDGQLAIGGVRLGDLASEHGTPLHVYDEDALRTALSEVAAGLESYPGRFRIAYATKAFAARAMLELVAAGGHGADVASEGELAVALAAGMDPALLVVHGNAKTPAQLRAAVGAGAGLVVVDSIGELDQLAATAAAAGRRQAVLLRVTPGIDADTHAAIRTGHDGSKFGIPPREVRAAWAGAGRWPSLLLQGIHLHVGSQLLDPGTFEVAARWAASFSQQLAEAGPDVTTLDMGGGLGIAYLPGAAAPSPRAWAASVATAVAQGFQEAGLALPELVVEPGRCIAGRAGVTLYAACSTKEVPGRRIVGVDGGMSDNPRPMLYGARYTCVPVSEPAPGVPTRSWTVAGMHCESGDELIPSVEITDPAVGDVLAIPASGAYGHSMASSYNLQLRAPVVFVSEGRARLVVRRETIEDLLARELSRSPI